MSSANQRGYRGRRMRASLKYDARTHRRISAYKDTSPLHCGGPLCPEYGVELAQHEHTLSLAKKERRRLRRAQQAVGTRSYPVPVQGEDMSSDDAIGMTESLLDSDYYTSMYRLSLEIGCNCSVRIEMMEMTGAKSWTPCFAHGGPHTPWQDCEAEMAAYAALRNKEKA